MATIADDGPSRPRRSFKKLSDQYTIHCKHAFDGTSTLMAQRKSIQKQRLASPAVWSRQLWYSPTASCDCCNVPFHVEAIVKEGVVIKSQHLLSVSSISACTGNRAIAQVSFAICQYCYRNAAVRHGTKPKYL
jgi:hypothetical protein